MKHLLPDWKYIPAFWLVLIGLASCHKPGEGKETYLADSTLVTAYSPEVLATIASPNDSMEYDPGDFSLRIYRITYKTKLDDKTPIIASGLIYLPSQPVAAKYPLISFQHATAYSQEEAPSGGNLVSPAFSYPLFYATHGYIVACPDYIGYGQSNQVSHPYEHRRTLARATADMLKAAREFLGAKTVWNNQLFLAGYSEGGFATLATQKLLEEENDLLVTTTACGAGPYAVPEFFNYIAEEKTKGGLANYIYIWQTLTYNRLYDIGKPVSYYFKSPYAEQITKSIENARDITASFDEICTDAFKEDIANPLSAFGRAMTDNDLTAWKPKSPLYLLHGDADEYIPFLNTEITYTAMEKLGSLTTSLVTIPKGTHIPTEILFIRRSVAWFNAARKTP